ncbi:MULTISPECIES: conjugal transfer protein TraD [unclassified Rickettsia]|uniref:conjugal transfer protein TraD n=1 Tax=Rickettsia endosymbiont of Ceutorhynchus obstrictus TaxID=3066249 RepID=UPI00209FE764|nr:conjugal transfer protein TraD [Rickettsia endosymbiont of Ceutorhynchus assimilis]
MDNIIKRRLKLQQRKAKIITEEARLKIQERKARTHHLIEIGGLVAKVKLDDLPSNSLLGAFISLKEKLIQNPNIQDQWTKICIIFRPLLTS